ncbi:hypothetical protein [Spiroplasma endosymbiont of Cantharis rufa]|uniref:hypothetical protein n=1 Tax=Spiroplasma endosymbiont of Cantharis rufa TaxID=3066279 RepID=UPI0030D537DF
MSGIVPKFCPTHLKIHTCELQNVFNKNKLIQEDLNAKIRRMHGIQTEEEINQSQSRQKDAPGSIGDILSKAKLRIKKEKEKIAKLSLDETETNVVTSEEINDRIAILKAKMNKSKTPSSLSKTSSDLQKVIENAQTYKKEHPETQYKALKGVNKSNSSEIILPRTKRPSIVSKKGNLTTIEPNKIQELKSKTIKPVSKTKINDKMFTQEETQELIQQAVKEALKQVGLIKDDNKSNSIKKPVAKKPINKNKK